MKELNKFRLFFNQNPNYIVFITEIKPLEKEESFFKTNSFLFQIKSLP